MTNSVVDASCGVSIYEVYFDSPGSDTGASSSLNAEWVQLNNNCSAGKSLTGSTVRDAAGHVYKFGGYTGAGSKAKVPHGQGQQHRVDTVLEPDLVHLQQHGQRRDFLHTKVAPMTWRAYAESSFDASLQHERQDLAREH